MVEEREAQKSSDRRESKLKFNPPKSSVEGKKLISFINNRQGQSERERAVGRNAIDKAYHRRICIPFKCNLS